MTLETLPKGRFHGVCQAGCRGQRGEVDTGIKPARYRLWLIGHPTLLCSRCGPEWARTYEEALCPTS